MPNPENLLGHEFTSDQDREQAAINGRKGGKARQKKLRERKRMREVLEQLLQDTYTTKDGREIDGTSMLMLAVMNKARRGDMRALEFIRATVGEDPIKQLDVTGNLKADQAKFTELLEQFTDEAGS